MHYFLCTHIFLTHFAHSALRILHTPILLSVRTQLLDNMNASVGVYISAEPVLPVLPVFSNLNGIGQIPVLPLNFKIPTNTCITLRNLCAIADLLIKSRVEQLR